MKKGFMLSMNWVVGLILILIGLVILMPIVVKVFSPKLDEEIINNMCWQSVLQNAERRLPIIEMQTAKVTCPTKYVTFFEDHAELEFEGNPTDTSRGNEPVKLDDYVYTEGGKKCEDLLSSSDREACMFRNINKLIANEIARCWNVFHQGQKRVFYLNRERQCMVCSVVMFDSEMIEEHRDKGMLGLYEPESQDYSLDFYMRNNSILRYTGEKTIYEYSLGVLDNFLLDSQPPYYDYSVDQEYAVVFVALNEDGLKSFLGSLWDKFKEKYTDFVPDEDEGNYINRLLFIPNDQVPVECDTFA